MLGSVGFLVARSWFSGISGGQKWGQWGFLRPEMGSVGFPDMIFHNMIAHMCLFSSFSNLQQWDPTETDGCAVRGAGVGASVCKICLQT